MTNYSAALAKEFSLQSWQTDNLISLIDEETQFPSLHDTEKRLTELLTIRLSAKFPRDSLICAISTPSVRRQESLFPHRKN